MCCCEPVAQLALLLQEMSCGGGWEKVGTFWKAGVTAWDVQLSRWFSVHPSIHPNGWSLPRFNGMAVHQSVYSKTIGASFFFLNSSLQNQGGHFVTRRESYESSHPLLSPTSITNAGWEDAPTVDCIWNGFAASHLKWWFMSRHLSFKSCQI